MPPPLVHVCTMCRATNGRALFYFSPPNCIASIDTPLTSRGSTRLAACSLRFYEPSGTCSQRCSPDGQKHPVTGFHYTIQTCCELMGGAACQHVPAPERQSRGPGAAAGSAGEP